MPPPTELRFRWTASAKALILFLALCTTNWVVGHEQVEGSEENADLKATGTISHGCTAVFRSETLVFAHCLTLGTDGAFKVLWNNYTDSDTMATVYFEGTPDLPYGWAAWGISPSGRMPSSTVILGYGSATTANAKLYELQGWISATALPDGQANAAFLSIDPASRQVEIVNNGNTIRIIVNVTKFGTDNEPVHIIWRGGPSMVGDNPMVHLNKMSATVHVDFVQGTAEGVAEEEEYSQQMITHAWLVGLGFGVLMPIGVLVSRHMKTLLDHKWFYVHATVQTIGYLLGVIGWSFGIWLSRQHGDFSQAPSDHQNHYNMGIAIFTFASVQILTPLAKPDVSASVRIYWNLVHWTLGYTTIILSFINVFLGFDLLEEDVGETNWKIVYIVFLCVWLLSFATLETLSWMAFSRKRQREVDMVSFPYDRQEKSIDSP